jgi:hypothetical protein
MRKHLSMNAEAGTFNLTEQDVTRIRSVTVAAVKRNWPWLCTYGVITLAGIVPSFFLNGWVNVAISCFVAVLTLLVALVMIQDVITIANDTG